MHIPKCLFSLANIDKVNFIWGLESGGQTVLKGLTHIFVIDRLCWAFVITKRVVQSSFPAVKVTRYIMCA